MRTFLFLLTLALWAVLAPQRVEAAPVVESVSTQQFATAATDHAVNMPATVNADELLIILFASRTDSTTISTPTGWTQLWNSTGGTGAAALRYAALARDADGTEDSTSVTITLNQSRAACSQVYRISGWGGDLANHVVTAINNPGTAGANPDPPSVTATWGSADNLFIATAGAADDDATFSAAPTNYTDLTGVTSGAGTNLGNEIGSARRSLTAASDDPGTFTISESEIWTGATIVVRPAAGNSIVPKVMHYRRLMMSQ